MNDSDIRAALQQRYCAPEWCLMHEVANGTGFSNKRYADCIAMNLFPSRGLGIHGIEIKVSRTDLLKELKQPEKADEIAQYCDFWFVATPKGLCQSEELPMSWGLIELHESGALRERKKPLKLDAKPLDRAFVAALARRINQLDSATISKLAEEMIRPERDRLNAKAEEFRQERDKYPHGLLKRYEDLLADVREFENAFGFKLKDGYRGSEDLCKAAEVVRRCGIAESYDGIIGLRNTIKSHLKKIEESIQQFGIEPPPTES